MGPGPQMVSLPQRQGAGMGPPGGAKRVAGPPPQGSKSAKKKKRLADKIECTENCFMSGAQADAIISGLDSNDKNLET